MSKKRTLNVRISLDGDLDPDDFSNEASAIFNEYLDAILAMDEGDRMTLRDSEKRIVGRAEVTGAETANLTTEAPSFSVPSPIPQTMTTINNDSNGLAYEENPQPPITYVSKDQRFGPKEFQATMEAPQKSDLDTMGSDEQLPTDLNSL